MYFYTKANLSRGDSEMLQWKSLTTGAHEGNMAALKPFSESSDATDNNDEGHIHGQ